MESTVENSIQISARYQVLSGAAYGIRQPTLVGELKTRLPSRYNFAGLKLFMMEALEGSVPDCFHQDESRICVFHLLYWSLLLQRLQKIPVFGGGYLRKIREDNGGNVSFLVALPYTNMRCSVQSLLWVIKTANLFFAKPELTQQEYDATEESLSTLLCDFRRYSIQGDNTFLFLSAAYELDLPFTQVLPGIYRFGTGKYSRHMESTLTDNTSVLGVGICQNKWKTASILRRAGLPVPKHKKVNSAEEAIATAKALGYPVVVKPADRERGEGVYANLPDSSAVEMVFQAASKVSRNILLEKHQEGESYRFTIFNGRVVNIFSRRPGGVTGNGIDTITELVKRTQQSPRFRRNFRLNGRYPLTLDEEALSLLSEKGLTEGSILREGEHVDLRRKSNISAGGSFENLEPTEVHPDNIILAIRIAKMLKLDFSGIDFITSDIKKSWLETETIVCEVNAMPQIGSAMTTSGYQGVLYELMQGNFSVDNHLLIYLSNSLQPTYDQILEISRRLDCNAFSTIGGIWVNHEQWSKPFENGFDSASALLACLDVESGLSVISMPEIRLYGLPIGNYKSIRFILPESGLLALENNHNFKETCELIRKHSQDFFLYSGTIDDRPPRLQFS